MKTWQAIILVITISLIGTFIPHDYQFYYIFTFAFITGLWLAIDSTRIEFEKYKMFMSTGPIGLFFATLFFPAIIFPCYIYERNKIKRGLIPLKTPAEMPAPPSSLGNLIFTHLILGIFIAGITYLLVYSTLNSPDHEKPITGGIITSIMFALILGIPLIISFVTKLKRLRKKA